MSPALPTVEVTVQAKVVPVLEWGSETFNLHDLLRDRYVATDATKVIKETLYDLDRMQRARADAPSQDALHRIVMAQQADLANIASILRTWTQSHGPASTT